MDLLVTDISTEEDINGGMVAIQGTEMAALHVYLPPSEERTGLKERVRMKVEFKLLPEPPKPEPLPPELLPPYGEPLPL